MYVDWYASYFSAGMEFEPFVSVGIYYLGNIFGSVPLVIWCMFWLSERYCKLGHSPAAEVLKNLALYFAFTMMAVPVLLSRRFLYKKGLLAALCHVGVNMSLVLAAFVWLPRRRLAALKIELVTPSAASVESTACQAECERHEDMAHPQAPHHVASEFGTEYAQPNAVAHKLETQWVQPK